jgi:hypothetical protein
MGVQLGVKGATPLASLDEYMTTEGGACVRRVGLLLLHLIGPCCALAPLWHRFATTLAPFYLGSVLRFAGKAAGAFFLALGAYFPITDP